MDPVEQEQFLASIAEVAKLIRQAQATLHRARKACHGEHYEHVDLIATRAFELLVRVEWMEQVALGNLPLSSGDFDPENRASPDRRRSVDRRVAGMRKALLQREKA